MNSTLSARVRLDLGSLLRGDVIPIARWIESWRLGHSTHQVIQIILGAGAFGAAMGFWRDPLQAMYAGIKLPLVMLATAGGNALINGMLAPLLGMNLCLKQAFAAVLSSFALASAILAAFSLPLAFLEYNLPPLERGELATGMVHDAMLVALFSVIAFAGVAANLRLLQLLRELSGTTSGATKILFAWLTVNLLLGSQLSWILRPFIGSPLLQVRFLRADAFHGSFFETLFAAARGLFFSFGR